MMWMTLLESIQDGRSGRASIKRLLLLIAGVTLALCCVILSIATLQGVDAEVEVVAAFSTLAAMAGGSYVGGKSVESRRGNDAAE